MKLVMEKNDVILMFLELMDALDEDPWDCANTFMDGAQGIICAIRAVAENTVEAEDWAVEEMDKRRAERYA